MPDAWQVLVACQLLNLTTRRQVCQVMPEIIKGWPSPESLAIADENELGAVITPLGLKNRRVKNLIAMAKEYTRGSWGDPRDLPGIGEYGARAYEIFILGKLGIVASKDGSLARYWRWAHLCREQVKLNDT